MSLLFHPNKFSIVRALGSKQQSFVQRKFWSHPFSPSSSFGASFIQKYSLNTFYLSGTILVNRDTSLSKEEIAASDSAAPLLRDCVSSKCAQTGDC